MRGWLAVPLILFDGQNYGFLQASDRLEGDFTEQDEAHLVRLATLTSRASSSGRRASKPGYFGRSRAGSRTSPTWSGVYRRAGPSDLQDWKSAANAF